MIAPMKKVFIVGRAAASEKLLEALRELSVVHLEAVDAGASAPEEMVAALSNTRRAAQIIEAVEPLGDAPELDAAEAAEEILAIRARSDEGRNRLSSLAREAGRLTVWGDLRCEQLEQLAAAGVNIVFYSVLAAEVAEVQAEFVNPLADLPGKRKLLAVIERTGEPTLPESAELVERPERDLPTVRAEANEIDAALAADAERLAQLANLSIALQSECDRLAADVQFAAAHAGALSGSDLFALQGWAPADAAEGLGEKLASRGMDAAVECRDPNEDEEPPTLIRYPRWASPIKGLFDILGTVPGYREIDVSVFFMFALPIFAAMLIGDAGYGLLFFAVPVVMYGKLVKAAGKPKTHLLIVLGLATIAWGVLTANYFGVTPNTIAEAGGFVKLVKGKEVADVGAMHAGSGGWAAVGNVMISAGRLWHTDDTTARDIIIKLSFIFGAIHLILAHIRQLIAFLPSLKALSQLGWSIFIAGMLGVIWLLFYPTDPKLPPVNVILSLLIVGGVLAILFTHPSRNVAKMLGMGLASSLLPALGAFSDTMSYIRLMAVGLASYYIASAFNGLGAQVAESATWFAAVPILLFGHGLNIGLAMIAIFAHGVRLNMLEFSSNVGVQWAGYQYDPFARTPVKES